MKDPATRQRRIAPSCTAIPLTAQGASTEIAPMGAFAEELSWLLYRMKQVEWEIGGNG
jgi:hypothetical protein